MTAVMPLKYVSPPAAPIAVRPTTPPASAARRCTLPFDFRPLAGELTQRAQSWTQAATFARLTPHAPAVISAHGNRSHAQLHDNATRLAHALRTFGLHAGDALALVCGNRPEFIEVFLAAMRLGLRLTPVNTHLTAAERAHIVADCGARLLISEHDWTAPKGVMQWLIESQNTATGAAPGAAYSDVLAQANAADFEAHASGNLMLYTSGTTGQAKGVFRREPEVMPPQFEGSFANYQPGDVALCAGPAYHAAPLLFDIRWPLSSGVPIVLMSKWDAAQALALIEQYRVTHLHLVPTMFQRLLALPAVQRAAHDLRSLRVVLHGAAPCTVACKRQMIDWLGPVLTEYYAATEGGDGIHVNSIDWLNKPGTVGRWNPDLGHCIVDDTGAEVAPGQVGRIFFKAPDGGRFEYFGDPQKTAAAYTNGRFTLGDMGYVDADGWLFLTGRAAECIISGGVNIYPFEIDEVLLRHAAVADVCTVGAPDDDWGERVVAVVVLVADAEASAALAAALVAHCHAQLAAFKCPREIVFDTHLPRTATDKLLRNAVRQRFWVGRERAI